VPWRAHQGKGGGGAVEAMASGWPMGIARPADGLERIGGWAEVDWVGPSGSAQVE
jgi:hypothetical protein